MKNNDKLYTINQAATYCSTSRSTIMRMEKEGILKPAYVNEDTGYRYYGTKEILRIIRNLSLSSVGVTHRELADYYSGTESYENLLESLEKKEKELRDLLAILRAQTGQEMHLHTASFDFPATYCYTKVLKGVTRPSSVRSHLWETIDETIEKGFSLKRELHPFVSVNAERFLKSDFELLPYDYTVNVPILWKGEEIPENVLFYPKCHTISALLYGGNKDIAEAFSRLGEQVSFHHFIPSGDARVTSIVNSYPGEEIPMEYWVSRVCIPIEDTKS